MLGFQHLLYIPVLCRYGSALYAFGRFPGNSAEKDVKIAPQMDARLETDKVPHSVDQPGCKRSRQSHTCSKSMPPGCATLSSILQARSHLDCKTTPVFETTSVPSRTSCHLFPVLETKKKRKPVLASLNCSCERQASPHQGQPRAKGGLDAAGPRPHIGVMQICHMPIPIE